MQFLGEDLIALEDLQDELRWSSFVASTEEISARRVGSFDFAERAAYFGFTADAGAAFVVSFPSTQSTVWNLTDGMEHVRAETIEDERFQAEVADANAANGAYQMPEIDTPFARTADLFPLRLGGLTFDATFRPSEAREVERLISVRDNHAASADRLLRGHWGRPGGAQASPVDESRLLSWDEYAAYIWDLEADQLEAVFQPGGAATWSPDAKWVAVVNAGRVNIYDTETKGRAASILTEGGAESAAFSPDGKMVAIVVRTARGNVIEVWRLGEQSGSGRL